MKMNPFKESKAIKTFRSGSIVVVPGGGGKYGEVRLPGTVAPDEKKDAPVVRKQKSLFDF
jgi:PHP family Zn ribbon phosphoesterase